MRIAKRTFLFVSVNILIVATLSTVLGLLGLGPMLEANGLNFPSLIAFCALWGFGASFISLALSRRIAKWTMGVRLIPEDERDTHLRLLKGRVHELSRRAGLTVMPEVGVYQSDEINAFATGPTRNRSLVAVSSGLLSRMSPREIDGVLAHEVAHVANGDMVTMTLVQGVVNAFVMFLARVAAFFAAQFVSDEKRPIVQFAATIALELVLGLFGMLVTAAFSRAREFRADAGGAALAGKTSMISALEGLRRHYEEPSSTDEMPALASLKISGRSGGLLRLLSTHPDLEARISRLKEIPAHRASHGVRQTIYG